ncbi:MAG TPA: baseplate J/gp47 family protein [Blastocatellia bacterium]|nr:baseplate J/gp47 family protein [Blastocatellia bacterium]
MPIQLPDLDDRRYKDLVEEALGMIPAHAPVWTNHNASDPGVTLVEMFAWLIEMMIYRLNRITPANTLSFLKLLNGSDWKPLGKNPEELTPEEIMLEVPKTIRSMRKLERAVSTNDFETLALEADPRVARASCLPRKNLEMDLQEEREGHISLIALPARNAKPEETADIIAAINKYLTPRLLVTTRLHVVKPFFVEVAINTSLALKADQKEQEAQNKIRDEIAKFFDPQPDAARDYQGWPFGRNVFTSEIFALLGQLPFVDFVKSVELSANFPGRELPGKAGIEVKPYELVMAGQVEVQIVSGQ